MEVLIKQQEQLMGIGEIDAAMKTIEGAGQRDTYASFSVTIGETSVDTSNFKPATVPVGRGFRQEFVNDYGNPHADLMIVMPQTAGAGPGQTVVRISGDPATVEALLKSARLR
jgi:hypothetical protein